MPPEFRKRKPVAVIALCILARVLRIVKPLLILNFNLRISSEEKSGIYLIPKPKGIHIFIPTRWGLVSTFSILFDS